VYGANHNYLEHYDLGSPVQSSTIANPYQASQPINTNYQYSDLNGVWSLRVQQNLPSSSLDIRDGSSGAYGTISDYVVVITDLSGTVFTFYQDLIGEITSLPRHGRLFATSRENTSYFDFMEAFQVDTSFQISTAPGGSRPLGLCYNDPGCISTGGSGPLLDDLRLLGDSPVLNLLRNERIVVYVPDAGYLGPDFFTYVIHQGSTLQQHLIQDGSFGSVNEVTANVRECRKYQSDAFRNMNRAVHPLCICAFNTTSTEVSMRDCSSNVAAVCSSTQDSRAVFINMCEACSLGLNSSSANSPSINSGACSVEIYRAVWFALDRGLCRDAPRIDCASETFTEAGSDARNYLSLKPPLLFGSLTALGNSFGGYGWFDSSTLI
jgi:hypothetical protein